MLSLFSYYFLWHYGEALSDLRTQVKNFIWFLYNFFTLPLLFKTIFAPWQRIEEHYIGGLHPGDMVSVILTNVIMRLVGFVIRFIVIICGLIALLAGILLAALSFIVWVLMPVILVLLSILSFRLLFT